MRGLVLCLLMAAPVAAQVDLSTPPVKAKQYVAYDSEAQVLPAGRRAVLELRFKVLPGFHVNSPRAKVGAAAADQGGAWRAGRGVKVAAGPSTPRGVPFSFAIDPSEKLDVYAGDFVVRVPVVAAAGPARVERLVGLPGLQQCGLLSAQDAAPWTCFLRPSSGERWTHSSR